MVNAVNASNLRVDDSGRVSLSGLGSGIDYQSSVDAIIAAKRIPIDRLETRLTSNDAKIAAYKDLNSLITATQSALKNLRGAVTLDNSSNAFAAKQAYASVSRSDGGIPSSAANLLGVSLTNAAAAGSHTIEVLQTAAAHKISSNAYASTSASLGFADGDQFTIEGKTITLSAGDSLLSLRDRINAANSGTTRTGVTASIVSVSATQNYLVLTKDTAGSAISLSETTNSPLADVGFLTGGGAVKNLLQAPRTAQLHADGLLDSSNKLYETARLTSGNVALGSNGTLRFNDGNGTVDIAYTSGMTVTDLANAINADVGLQGKGIGASVVTEGGQVRLKLTGTGDAFTMTETGGGSALATLGMGNARLLIERNTNTVSDLFAGVTLNLFQAEIGTTVKIDIEADLNSVKTAVTGFVESYNALKTFINTQTYIDPDTGKAIEDATLTSSRTLKSLESQINQILGRGTVGVSSAFSVLAQIGVNYVNNSTLSDPLLADTLEINESKLDAALLNNPDDVRRLFAFDFSASNPAVTMLGFSNKTTYNADGYVLNIGPIGSAQETSGSVANSAATLNDGVDSVGAAASGLFTINGKTIIYDVTVDTLDSIAAKINNAGLSANGIGATVVTNDSGEKELRISSNKEALSIGGDSGDLLASLGLTTTATLITSANIGGAANGADNGTVTISGMTVTVTSASGAEGLRMIYTGTAPATVQLDFTVGIATQMYNLAENALDTRTGSIQAEINSLTTQNTETKIRVDTMLARLERQRQSLLNSFIAMETALTTMNNLLESIKSTYAAMTKSNN
ncbi:MAG: flagellar filament capping protein FliD [Alphaproteobacteria bacterium]